LPETMKLSPIPVSQPLLLAHGGRNRCCMVGLLVCLSLLTLLQCAPRITPVPPRVRVVPANVQQSASPKLSEARRDSSKADRHNAAATVHIGGAKSGMQESQTEMQSLVSEVGRLQAQKRASENELLALYNRLVAQDRRASAILQNLNAAEVSLAEERTLRRRADESVIAAEALVHAKDAEASQLRSQLAHAEQISDSYEQASTRNAELAAKAKADADKSAGTIETLTKFLIGVSIALALSIVGNLLFLKATFRL